MSRDLVTADSTFSTSMMQPEALEILASAWARALVNNTGWLAYMQIPWPTITGTMSGTEAGDDFALTNYVWLTAGTWVIGAKMCSEPIDSWRGTLIVDGTTIFEDSFQATGSEYVGTIIASTSKWVTFKGSCSVITADSNGPYHMSGYYRPYGP